MARKIENKLYKITIYCGEIEFVEAKTEEDLFEYVAKKVIKGEIITSVVRIMPDGKTPKIAIFTNKEYIRIYKELTK